MFKFETIGTYYDETIGYDYSLCRMKAKDLSEYLKESLQKKGIDYNNFNPGIKEVPSWELDNYMAIINKPPQEIYEYQNFFLF